MKKMYLKIGSNYLILLLGIIFFPLGAVGTLLLPVAQLLLTIGNYKWSSDLKYFLYLQINMLIATMIGNFVNAQLYLKYVSNDAESVVIFALIFRVGVLVVMALSILFGIAKFVHCKRQTQKKN